MTILAARVKQTQDANKKWQTVPFKKGDLAYLSSKNISFPKGLAQKLLRLQTIKVIVDSCTLKSLPENVKLSRGHSGLSSKLSCIQTKTS